MGRGRKGHKASEFRESKFGRQGFTSSKVPGPREGPKVGPKICSKVGTKVGTKVGSKWGSKKWDPKNFEKSEKLFRASNAT